MATNVFKRLAQTQLSATTATTIYTVPSLTATVVAEIAALNISTTTSATVTVFQGGSASSNQITSAITLGPGESFRLIGPHPMAAADTIIVQASVANIINVNMSGDEIVAANV